MKVIILKIKSSILCFLILFSGSASYSAAAQKKESGGPQYNAASESPSCAISIPRQGWVNPEYRARLQSQFDASEEMRNDQASTDSLIYGSVYNPAARAGISEASFVLSQLYLQKSQAGDRNAYARFVQFRLQAAQQGHPQAQFELGEACYMAASPHSGRVWIIRSAEQGNEQAKRWLDNNP